MILFVVRHGETVGNREGRWLGRSDSPLTVRGIEQVLACADALAASIGRERGIALQTSPLCRARQTAALIADRLGLEERQCSVSPLLVEHDFGRWEGLTEDEIEARFPGEQAARHRSHWTYVVPGGENYRQVFQRARRWLDQQRDAPVTIAVTHAKTSRALRGAYLDLPPPEILKLKHPQDRVFKLQNKGVEPIY